MTTSLDDIAAFVAVVEGGGFTAGAERLGLSPSVLSKRVRALEERLETQLIIRTTRRLELTDAGEVFYADVAGVPARLRDAEERARSLSGAVRGRLRVVLPTYFESDVLHDVVVPEFLEAHPEVELTVVIAADPARRFHESFDLLVAGRLPSRRFPDTSLITRHLLQLPGALYASPAYLERHGAPSHPEELASHNCLGYLNPEWHFTDAAGRSFFLRASGSLATNSNAMLRAATVRGLGVTYSFPVYFAEDEREGRVVRILEEFTASSYVDLHIFYPQAEFVPERTRAFIAALTAAFSREGEGGVSVSRTGRATGGGSSG